MKSITRASMYPAPTTSDADSAWVTLPPCELRVEPCADRGDDPQPTDQAKLVVSPDKRGQQRYSQSDAVFG